jgi:hypothetical protein
LQYTWLHNGQVVAGAGGRTLTVTNVALTNAGSYQVYLANALGLAVSDVATLTMIERPALTREPQDLMVAAGTTPLLSVAADSVVPAGYQWRREGAALSGETNATLTLTNVGLADAGSFDVVVTNLAGGVTSRLAAVVVAVSPGFTLEPFAQTQSVGGLVTLTSAVAGSGPFTYQWRRNGAVLTGATNQFLTLTNLSRSQEGYYSIAVTNIVGARVSSNAFLRVLAAATLQAGSSGKLSNGRFRLHFGDAVGDGLSQNLAGRFSVEASDNLRDWVVVSTNGAGLVVTNGQFRFEDIGAITRRFRFYRVLEH